MAAGFRPYVAIFGKEIQQVIYFVAAKPNVNAWRRIADRARLSECGRAVTGM
jgi:hypothetical protein